MRTLKNSGLVHNNNYAIYPEGAIQDETEDLEGTPVVKAVYNDLLMNIYAFLKDRGVNFNNQEDNQQNGYQLINALRRNVNELNDIEKILNFDGSIWSIDLNFDIIPNKYFVFARSSENYSSGNSIKGSTPTNYTFESLGFKSGDELLLIIDSAKVRAYNISSSSSGSVNNEGFPLIGRPLRYLQDIQKIWYENNGNLYSSLPESYTFENLIKSQSGNSDLVLLDIFQVGSRFVCFCLDSETFDISFYYFDSSDFSTAVLLTFNIPVNNYDDDSFNRVVNAYFNGSQLLISNEANNSDSDYKISSFNIDFDNDILNFDSVFTLESSFPKTTNSAADDLGITTFVNGNLRFYSFASQVQSLGFIPDLLGMLFKAGNQTYIANGNSCVKLNV